MTSEQYFEHLCRTEAGEFIYKTVENVKGFYFMRPPKRPTDDDLRARYSLEAPEIERSFQLLRANPDERGRIFVGQPWKRYEFVEEPAAGHDSYLRSFGYKQGTSPMTTEVVPDLKSRYGLIWRGIRRDHDRQLAIAGSEWIVFDLKTAEVLAMQRDYGRTGFNGNSEDGIWWLNALGCPQITPRDNLPSRFYHFATRSLKPYAGDPK